MKAVKPKKNLGQHFLTDLNIAKRIADTVDACPDIPVLEIGPGMGVLTQYLVEKPRPVKAVEIDSESVAYLHENFPTLKDNIIGEDFLRMDLNQIFDGKQFVLTGNYPYDISSQIFFKMLDYKDLIPCCTGMIQREVALRMASEPGNKAYGILSVLIQAWYDVEYLFTVDENVFNPPPKVKSAVIRMTRNKVTDLGCDEKLFKRLVKTVFNQRRKMLRVSLKQMFPGVTPREDFYTTDIMTKRPEQLTIQQFVELTNYALAPAKVSSINVDDENKKAEVYLQPEEVSLAIGRGGMNIKLASMLTEYTIDVFREVDENEADEDIYLDEFSDEIDQWVIDAIKGIGLDTAKQVLNAPRNLLIEKADLEEETVDHVLSVLRAEFEQ